MGLCNCNANYLPHVHDDMGIHPPKPSWDSTRVIPDPKDSFRHSEAVSYVQSKGYTEEAAQKIVSEHGVDSVLSSKIVGSESTVNESTAKAPIKLEL